MAKKIKSWLSNMKDSIVTWFACTGSQKKLSNFWCFFQHEISVFNYAQTCVCRRACIYKRN